MLIKDTQKMHIPGKAFENMTMFIIPYIPFFIQRAKSIIYTSRSFRKARAISVKNIHRDMRWVRGSLQFSENISECSTATASAEENFLISFYLGSNEVLNMYFFF